MSLANATLSTSPISVFTCVNAGGSAVVSIMITNTDSVSRTVDVHACPAAVASAAEANAAENLIFSKEIPAGDTFVFSEKILLGNNDDLKMLTTATATDVVATVSYLDL